MKNKILVFMQMLICCVYAFSANLSVDTLEIMSDLHFDTSDDQLKNSTYFNLRTSIDGGYKFAATVGFEANTAELEENYANNSNLGLGTIYLFFHDASVTARNLLDSHLDLAFWTGTFRYLGSGNFYKGYLFYPASTNEKIDGFYRLRGTGVSSVFKLWEDRLRIRLHLYENTNFILPTDTETKLNYFSFDNEIGLYLDFLYFEFFYGYTKDITWPNDRSTLYAGRGKAGFTFWVGNKDVEFFTTAGVPDLDNETLSDVSSGSRNMFDSLYLLAELKFNLYITTNTISFLTVPSLYNEEATDKETDFDINYTLLINSPEKMLNGGFYAHFTYDIEPDNSFEWHFTAAPYFSILISGVKWFISTGYDFSAISDASSSGDNSDALGGLSTVIGVSSCF